MPAGDESDKAAWSVISSRVPPAEFELLREAQFLGRTTRSEIVRRGAVQEAQRIIHQAREAGS